MLSDISKIFDPLGSLLPMTFVSTRLTQQSWKANIDLVEKSPHDLISTCLSWRSQLVCLKEKKLYTFSLFYGFSDKIELHILIDASEKAYSAAVYIVAVHYQGRR